MSIHNTIGLAFLSATYEAIYYIAKHRVLDRYPEIEPSEEDMKGLLHAWHFERPDSIQKEIYAECVVVANNFDVEFNEEDYLTLMRLSYIPDSYHFNPKLVAESSSLAYFVDRYLGKNNFIPEVKAAAKKRLRIDERSFKAGLKANLKNPRFIPTPGLPVAPQVQ